MEKKIRKESRLKNNSDDSRLRVLNDKLVVGLLGLVHVQLYQCHNVRALYMPLP